MSCCNAKRPMVYLSGNRAGVAGYVSRYGETDEALNAALTPGVGTFGKMVGAGVTIWAITKVLDSVFLKRGGR